MKLLSIYIVIFLSILCYGQQTKEWLRSLENPQYESDSLEKENVISEYLKYDFSTLLTPHSEFLGFIGSGYQRLHIYFTSVEKNQNDDKVYNIKGISLVKDNSCNFNGEIIIEQIRQYKTLHYGLDDTSNSEGLKAEGVLIGKYIFREDSSEINSGKFQGIMTLYWYLDNHNIIHYDDIEIGFSDGYCNNQYIGEWISYKSKKTKICNWGEYRIPFSGDLDIGAAEFSPDSIYYSKGWEDFKNK